MYQRHKLLDSQLTCRMWCVGTCLPAGILDINGYLVRHQQQIHSLSLITDGTCPHAGRRLEGLSSLTALTDLEWEGIQHPFEMRTLCECLRHNHRRLKAVSIGLLLDPSVPTSHEDILKVFWPPPAQDDCTSGEREWFPSLTSLTFSRVPFPDSLLPGGQPSPFRALKALTVRDCPNEQRFLQLLARVKDPLSLQHFEICSDYLRDSEDRLASIATVEFLLSFRGLRRLYLKVVNFPRFLPGLGDAIKHHRVTLHGLVFHERRLMPIDAERLFEDLRDVNMASPSIPRILQHSSPVALGLCLRPASARGLLLGIPERSSIKLLHLRLSGEERIHRHLRREIVSELQRNAEGGPWSRSRRHGPTVAGLHLKPARKRSEAEDFVLLAQWAFGPTGLPALQILAFGDFSHDGRYSEQQILIRRKRISEQPYPRVSSGRECSSISSSFCLVDSDDRSLWDGLPLDGTQFLSACPGTGLMESPYDL
ncbi:hypothetical protein AAWM_08346 [Aspergillus awamori]|uniref:F-box domain-containing protein n=1 Tax=Aspergillus awamori TaxID=105351 RepID=A0A401L1S0_ASPAW|nr:hypothetical protein AAWM_08346 [Aspergillus awamori]GKZ63596.1 hypothetical protein AnigIFM49718_001518 [Aspergillus niger]GLA21801.1 hypothetical protein AnigIFM62618_001357 [Aspergillus niger]